MRKWLIIGGIILVLIVMAVSSYNGLVSVQADTKTAWSKVESAYQRRNDLIGNLVKTVQGAADYEKSTLEAVITARSKATGITIDPTNVTPEQLAQFQQAQSGLTSSLSRLLVTVEQYPDLKANQNFLELQSQLEGTENRINVERDRFNDAANVYDKKTRSFPSVIFAKLFGFGEIPRFKADEGAEKAKEVEFNFGNKEDKKIMSKVEDFLTKAEEAEIVEAIRLAEKNTSGEIRVHLEKETSIAPVERAVEVFHELQMDATQLRNGVIIYVAVKSKQFAIYGDKGINDKVADDFWDCTKDIMVGHFKNGNNAKALVEGIHNAGEQLKKHFPFEDNDTDELTNEISKDDTI